MQNHIVQIESTYKAKNVIRTSRGVITGTIQENGVNIASFRRGAVQRNFVPDFEIKFFSDASKARFDTYCDCLSRSETLECLLG